jgi:HNH endonuclease
MIRACHICQVVLLATALLLSVNTAPARASSSTQHRSTSCTTCPRDSHGRIKRSSSARSAFLKSKSLKRTPKGCQVDHIKPLAKGGKDEAGNMQLLW